MSDGAGSHALGMIETFGLGSAITAADAALKAANVSIRRIEQTIGSGGSLGTTVFISGEVAAVRSAIDAGDVEASRVGKVVSTDIIPRLDGKVLSGMYHGELEL